MTFSVRLIRAAMLALPLLAVACDGQGLGQTLGFDRRAPDEFTVVSRPSLSVPPEFTLRPPKPGEPPRGIAADAEAHQLLTGKETLPSADSLTLPSVDTAVTPVITSEATSAASSNFLKKLGAEQADDEIRTKLAEDAVAPVDTSKAGSLYEQLVGKEKIEPTVDAAKESERLRDNKDAGKPINEGAVPDAPMDSPSLVDKIF